MCITLPADSNVLYKQNLLINAFIHNNKIHWGTLNMSYLIENTHHKFPEPSLMLVLSNKLSLNSNDDIK